MTDDLAMLVEKARFATMTQGEYEAQRLSFAFGSANIENAIISREIVKIAAAGIDNRQIQTVQMKELPPQIKGQ